MSYVVGIALNSSCFTVSSDETVIGYAMVQSLSSMANDIHRRNTICFFGNVPMSHLPEHLQVACDEAIAAFNTGDPEPESFKQITEWLEEDGWDALIADLGDQMAITLTELGYYRFTDIELRANSDITDDQTISDIDRLRWGREQIDYVLDNDDDDMLSSVHAYKLTSSDGQSAWIGCLVEIHGQLGPACYWQGLWSSREAFWNALGSEHGYWVTPLMGEVTDEVILSHWKKPKRTGKLATNRTTERQPSE